MGLGMDLLGTTADLHQGPADMCIGLLVGGVSWWIVGISSLSIRLIFIFCVGRKNSLLEQPG